MTINNPEHGEVFYDDTRQSRLRYIGRDSAERLIMEDLDLVGVSLPFVSVNDQWVVYYVPSTHHEGNAPKIKSEIAFRRVFGHLIRSVDSPGSE